MNIPKLIPIMEIPKHLPVSLPTVRAWVHYKQIPVIRLGRKVFIKESELERIANEGIKIENVQSASVPPPINQTQDTTQPSVTALKEWKEWNNE